MTPTEDYFICRELSCLETHFRNLIHLLPQKIAQMESVAPQLPAHWQPIQAKLIAREKIMLFCALELAKIGYTAAEEGLLRQSRDTPIILDPPNDSNPSVPKPEPLNL